MPDRRADQPDGGDGFDPSLLADVEIAVQRALAQADASALAVLGYGEITLVVGWPRRAPRWACKRLPVFASVAAAQDYREKFDRYLAVLGARGVSVVPTELHTMASGGGVVAYVVQPVLAPTDLGPEVLRVGDPAAARRLIDHIVEIVPAVVDQRTGFDGQISNWALVDGEPRYLDVSTPLLFDPSGRLEIEIDLFLAAYPWVMRAPIRRWVAPGVIGAYRRYRHVLVDLAANLAKERLDGWRPEVIDAVNTVVRPAVTEAEVRRFYRSDSLMWELMARARRADRWWQRRVRRRPYPFLLPGPVRR